MSSSPSGPILVVDTSAAEIAVALGFADGRSALLRHRPTGFLSEQLQPAVERLLEAEGTGIRDVAGVAVVRGPGSFTGLRVGLAWVLGVAEARSIPAVGLSSLEALDEGARLCGASGAVAALLRSGNRRGDWYGALFEREGGSTGSTPRIEPGVVPGDRLEDFLAPAANVVGDLPPVERLGGRPFFGRAEGLPGALALARRALASPAAHHDPLLPVYLLEPAPVEKLREARP